MGNPEGHNPRYWRKHPEQRLAATAKSSASMDNAAPSKRERFNQFLGIVGVALALASWGWTVISPDTSVTFGSILLFGAVLTTVVAVARIVQNKFIIAAICVVALAGFSAFDWYFVISPQKGKQFKSLLVDGYHIADECGAVPASTQMPDWMKDQSTRWQAKAEELITDKLDYKDLQLWREAVVFGLIRDANLNAYQCLSLGNKIGALETIISRNYDPSLKHAEYNGPTYWLNSSNGEVDISDAFKGGIGSGSQRKIYIYSGPDASVQTKVTGKIN
jgi:hypothetical protein